MTRVSTSEEGRPAGVEASSFKRAGFAGACGGYERCFVRMSQGYGADGRRSTMQPEEVVIQLEAGSNYRLLANTALNSTNWIPLGFMDRASGGCWTAAHSP